MKKILILYPEQFNCFSKFTRKLTRILQNMNEFAVIFPKDPNGLIVSFFKEKFPKVEILEKLNWELSDITHAIVFDDGEEFSEESAKLKDKNVPLRLIEIAITRVVNINSDTEYQNQKSTSDYEYIGRGSYWGNPYSMYEDGDDREEVIRKYRYDFDHDAFPKKEKSQIYKFAGKRLGCFCKPQSCHGDILADFLNSWDDGK